MTTRRVPSRRLHAGVLIGLGFVLGLATSGVLTQLSGGPAASAQAAEAESQSPSPTPPPRMAPPFGWSPTPAPTPAPTPTPGPTPTPASEAETADEDDDDGPVARLRDTAPRAPRVPSSARAVPQHITDAFGLGDDGASRAPDEPQRAEGPQGGTDAASVQPGSVIQGPVYVTIVYEGDIDIESEQEADAGSGDALAASQVMAAVTGGNADLEGRNTAGGGDGDILARTGPADAQNNIEVTGPFVQGGIDWRDVTINGPVSWSVVFEDDVKLKFKQKGTAATGQALADSQSFAVSADGDADVGAWNLPGDGGGGGQSTARSGDAQVSNTIDIQSSLVVGDFALQGSTLNGALTQSVAYHEDFKIKFKQDFMTVSGLSAAATQYIDEIHAGRDVGIVIDNRGSGTSRSGDSGGSNVVEAGSNVGGGPSIAAAAPGSGALEPPSPSSTGDDTAPSAERTTSDAAPASSTLSAAGWGQALLLAAGLALGLARRRSSRHSRRRGAQTSRAGSA